MVKTEKKIQHTDFFQISIEPIFYITFVLLSTRSKANNLGLTQGPRLRLPVRLQ